jgi:hypothetical protein
MCVLQKLVNGYEKATDVSYRFPLSKRKRKKSKALLIHPRPTREHRLKGGRDGVLGDTGGLGPLSELGDRLVASDTTTPVLPGVLVLVTEVGLGGLDEGGEGLVVLGSNVLEGNNGSGLLVNDRSETGLVLDDDVRDTHLRLIKIRVSF